MAAASSGSNSWMFMPGSNMVAAQSNRKAEGTVRLFPAEKGTVPWLRRLDEGLHHAGPGARDVAPVVAAAADAEDAPARMAIGDAAQPARGMRVGFLGQPRCVIGSPPRLSAPHWNSTNCGRCRSRCASTAGQAARKASSPAPGGSGMLSLVPARGAGARSPRPRPCPDRGSGRPRAGRRRSRPGRPRTHRRRRRRGARRCPRRRCARGRAPASAAR